MLSRQEPFEDKPVGLPYLEALFGFGRHTGFGLEGHLGAGMEEGTVLPRVQMSERTLALRQTTKTRGERENNSKTGAERGQHLLALVRDPRHLGQLTRNADIYVASSEVPSADGGFPCVLPR